MKIHQLPNGARFEYEGEEYVKSGPLFATGKDGQRLIPKYAVLTPLSVVEAAPDAKRGDALPRAKVLEAFEAFEAFHAECKALVPDERQAALDVARERFLKSIE